MPCHSASQSSTGNGNRKGRSSRTIISSTTTASQSQLAIERFLVGGGGGEVKGGQGNVDGLVVGYRYIICEHHQSVM